MAVTAEIDRDVFATKVDGKLESLPYYDEVEKKIKYRPALFNIGTRGEEWYKNGELNSFNGEPAIVRTSGAKMWYKNNKLHRDVDLPAVIYSNGSKEYYKNNKLHRDNNLPAIIYENGLIEYYKNGVKYTPKSEQKEDDYFSTFQKKIEDDYFSTFQKKIEDDYLVALYKKILDDKSLSVDQKQDSIISLAHLSMIINKK